MESPPRVNVAIEPPRAPQRLGLYARRRAANPNHLPEGLPALNVQGRGRRLDFGDNDNPNQQPDNVNNELRNNDLRNNDLRPDYVNNELRNNLHNNNRQI